jgi:Spy/CpxP family protein refolding chaperone
MTEHTPLGAADTTPLAQPSRAPRLAAIAVLFIVALAGIIGGVALERSVLRPQHWAARNAAPRGERRVPPRRPSAMLPSELKLTAEQAARIDTLIERQMLGFREIRRSTQPAIDSLMAQTKRSMDSILSPAQRTLLDSSRARREREYRRRSPDGAPPRGPGERWRAPEPRP